MNVARKSGTPVKPDKAFSFRSGEESVFVFAAMGNVLRRIIVVALRNERITQTGAAAISHQCQGKMAVGFFGRCGRMNMMPGIENPHKLPQTIWMHQSRKSAGGFVGIAVMIKNMKPPKPVPIQNCTPVWNHGATVEGAYGP